MRLQAQGTDAMGIVHTDFTKTTVRRRFRRCSWPKAQMVRRPHPHVIVQGSDQVMVYKNSGKALAHKLHSSSLDVTPAYLNPHSFRFDDDSNHDVQHRSCRFPARVLLRRFVAPSQTTSYQP